MSEEFPIIPPVTKRYMTLEQVCEYLDIGKHTVYRLIAKRDIPFMVISKRVYRFDPIKIDEWMSKKSMKTVAEA